MPLISRAIVRALLPFAIQTNNGRPIEASAIGHVVESTFPHSLVNWLQFCPHEQRDKPAPSAYFNEYEYAVQRFLFDAVGATGCYYLRLNPEVDPRLKSVYDYALAPLGKHYWISDDAAPPNAPTLRGLELLSINSKDQPIKANPPNASKFDTSRFRVEFHETTGVELWISRLGVGILSVSLDLKPNELTEDSALDLSKPLLDFNHALATAQKAIWLRPQGTATKALSSSSQSKPKETFHIHQLLRSITQPMWQHPQAALRFSQRATVYCSLQVTVPPEQLAVKDEELDALLSHLAQVHPSTHPDAASLTAAPRVAFNVRHFCRLSACGAAHATIVSGDDKGAYDAKRIERAHIEYFPGFLLAQLQHQCYRQLRNESVEAANAQSHISQRDNYREIFAKALKTGLEGEFAAVSWRPQLQQHYMLAQQVYQVKESRASFRQSLTDFARASNEEESESAESAMRIVEAFVVTIYSVELAHILGKCFHFTHNAFLGWSLAVVGATTFMLVAAYVTRRRIGHPRIWGSILALFLLTTAIQAAFLGVNWKWNLEKSSNDDVDSTHAGAANLEH